MAHVADGAADHTTPTPAENLLGAILLGPEVLKRLKAELTPGHFPEGMQRRTFEAIQRLSKIGDSFGVEDVQLLLGSSDETAKYLEGLTASIGSPESALFFAEQVNGQVNGHTWRHVRVKTNQRQDLITCQVRDALARANSEPGRYKFKTGNLFLSGGRQVTVNTAGAVARIEGVGRGWIAEHVCEIVEFEKNNAKLGHLPQWLLPVLENQFQELPRLDRVSSLPFFDHGGRFIAKDGYHASSKTWTDLGDLEIPSELPTTVSAESRDKAVQDFRDLFQDFPLVGEADLANLMAQFVIPLVRPMITGHLMGCLIEASTPGSGKTLLAQLLGVFMTGREPNLQPLDLRREAEIQKVLTSIFISGAPLAVLDNLAGWFDSPAMASAITTEMWQDRILGHSELIRVPAKTQFVLTANNLQLTKELADRLLRVRLVPDVEDPRQRSGYAIDQIVEHMKRERSRYVWDASLIVKNWFQTGMNSGQIVQGSFDHFSEVVGGILKAAGVPGFLANRDDFATEAASADQEWGDLVEIWWERFNGRQVKASDLNRICEVNDLLFYLRDCNRPEIRLSKKLAAEMRNRVFGGKMICLEKSPKQHAKTFYLKEVSHV